MNKFKLTQARTNAGVWELLMDYCLHHGILRPTDRDEQFGPMAKAIKYGTVVIDKPISDYMCSDRFLGESKQQMETYALENLILDGLKPKQDYNYGHQINKFDQLNKTIEKIKKSPNERTHIVMVNEPKFVDMNHKPCLTYVAFERDDVKPDRMNLDFYFRSWDLWKGAPTNLFGLSRLLEYVCKETNFNIGFMCGFYKNLHIYEKDLELARETFKHKSVYNVPNP